jgi:hypothetical protein
MEFFTRDSKTEHLKISPQIWIYFATAAGMTALTMVLYTMMGGRLNRRENQDSVAKEATDYNIPHSLKRGSTDIERNSPPVGIAGWIEK